MALSRAPDLREKCLTAAAIALPILCGAILYFWSGVIGAAAREIRLAYGSHPYFVPEHAFLLYFAAPVIALSAGVLLLSPGLFLSRATGASEDLPEWMISGLIFSIGIVSIVTTITQELMGTPLRGTSFLCIVLACYIGCTMVGLLLRRKSHRATQLFRPDTRATLSIATAIPLILAIALAPKIYWESFNGDGLHLYESARLLLFQPSPFWPESAGPVAGFPNLKAVLFVFPVSWFVRLFGEFEASARLPYLLLQPVLYVAIIGLVEQGRVRKLGVPERILIAIALLLLCLVTAFSATEDPYSSDMALPGVQDTLFMIVLCGLILAFLREKTGWAVAYTALAYMTSPNAIPIIGLWLLSAIVLIRPLQGALILKIGATLAAVAALDTVPPILLKLAGAAPPHEEHGIWNLIPRLVDVQIRQLPRFAWAFAPVGICPAIALVSYKWQDQTTQAIALTAFSGFCFYYFQSQIALHYFMPVAILSLIAFWRTERFFEPGTRKITLSFASLLLVVSVFVSWPRTDRLNMASRIVGNEIEDRTDGYDRGDPAIFGRLATVQALFPRPSASEVPNRSYGGAPNVWLYYAHRGDGRAGPRNYVLQWASAPPVPGARLVKKDDKVALYVRSQAVWDAHKAMRPLDPSGSLLYAIPKWVRYRWDWPKRPSTVFTFDPEK